MSAQVIVLNGASSSGKTSIARCLQAMLTPPCLRLGIDDLIRAMPDEGIEDGSLLHIGDGGGGQERLRTALGGLEVLWVGVMCDREVARAREALRPDRVAGMAEFQAAAVHEGVVYDMIVDTSHATSESCAARILAQASTIA